MSAESGASATEEVDVCHSLFRFLINDFQARKKVEQKSLIRN